MGNRIGILKIAAQRTGQTLEEYITKAEAGLKWCHKCRLWKKRTDFESDKSRGDGLKSICRSCSYQRKTLGPTKAMRKAYKAKGLVWCRVCQVWASVSEVHAGLCRSCANAEARRRYVTDARFRIERRQHAHSRKRGIEPILPEDQEALLQEFDGCCAYCLAPATTWDHIIPVSKGGDSTRKNIVPACRSCNSSKKAKDVTLWLQASGKPQHPALISRLFS